MKNLDFVQGRKVSYVISSLLIIISVVLLFTKGLNWSIDFTGGQQIMLKLDPVQSDQKAIAVDEIRDALMAEGLDDATIQPINYKMDGETANQLTNSALFIIKIGESDQIKGNKKSLGQSQIITAIQKNIKDYKIDSKATQTEVVSASIGKELKANSVKSVLFALILMVIYIGIRFQFNFGFAAIIALFHDVLFVLGVFALCGFDMSASIIAALLSIVGYSINDTIVVFDRIREDMRRRKSGQTLGQVFNLAINSTISRTIITSLTTLLAAVSLYVFGGIAIRDFSFAIILGTIVGTYSSVFVASPLVLDYFHMKNDNTNVFSRIMKKK